MKKLQAGFSLVTAIFLLVVIATLGTFAVTLSTTQNQSQAMDALGASGYQAALAGVEWAAYQVSISASNAASPVPCSTSFSPGALAGNLALFTVTVNCAASSVVEGSTTYWLYSVSSVAQTTGNPGDVNYVEQIATAKLGK
ncbi:MAG: hypothetical protein WCK93_07115 [Nitrosomonadales bacterium]|jgi:MSHA biogenesis protein MshP